MVLSYHAKPHIYVGEVHLLVEDLSRSIQFYQDMIGFQILSRSERLAVFTTDGQTPILTVEQPVGVLPKEPRKTGLYHFAILLPNRMELGKFLQHMIEKGYPLQGASDHDVSEAIYLADPDGNGIEVYRDRPDDTWVWEKNQVMMSTKPLDVNGVLAEARGASWSGLPADTVIGHIHLHVSELQKTQDFYNCLGFEVVLRYGSQALFISSGKYHHHIGLNTWNGVGVPAPSRNSVGIKYFTLIYPTQQERDKAIQHLLEMDVEVEEKQGFVVTRDPSGTAIHLLVKQNVRKKNSYME